MSNSIYNLKRIAALITFSFYPFKIFGPSFQCKLKGVLLNWRSLGLGKGLQATHWFLISTIFKLLIYATPKSKLFFSPNTPTDVQHHIASLANMPIVTNLGKYLGMPLILKWKTNSTFQPLLDKIQSRIQAWQSKLISQDGSVTLIKSVLSPLAYHSMQTTLLPKGSLDNIDKLIRSFLWDDTAAQKHMHLLNWETITKPKLCGSQH